MNRFALILRVTLLALTLGSSALAATPFSLKIPWRESNWPTREVRLRIKTTGGSIAGTQLKCTDCASDAPITLPATSGTSPPSSADTAVFRIGWGPTSSELDITFIRTAGSGCIADADPAPAAAPDAKFVYAKSFSLELPTGVTASQHWLTSYRASGPDGSSSGENCACSSQRVGSATAATVSGLPGAQGTHPHDLLLVLDESGSMSESVGGASKMNRLKDAVGQLVSAWSLLGGSPQDRLGAVMFSTGATALGTPFWLTRDSGSAGGNKRCSDLGASPTGFDQVLQRVCSRNPTNMTAIGKGLWCGLEQAERRTTEALQPKQDTTIFLVTDGLQNISPNVNVSGTEAALNCFGSETGCGQTVSRSVCAGGITSISFEGAQMCSHRYFTVGVDVEFSDTISNMLQFMAQQSGAQARLVSSGADLSFGFLTNWVTALEGSSPQIVLKERAALSGTSAAKTFSVDGSAERLVVLAAWEGATPLTLEVKNANGTVVNGVLRNGGGHVARGFAIPNDGAGGNWTATVSGQSGQIYELTAIVEQGKLGFAPRLSKGLVTARVTWLGKPLPNLGAAITVTPLGPQTGAGTLLHNQVISSATVAQATGQLPPDSGQTPYDKKVAYMRQQPTFRQQVLPQTALASVTLVDDGSMGDTRAQDGVYSSNLSLPSTPGIYELLVRLDATTPDTGRIVRQAVLTHVVGLAEVDSRRSLRSTTLPTGGYKLIFTPQDSAGNFYGPGYERQIRVSTRVTGGGIHVPGQGGSVVVVPGDGTVTTGNGVGTLPRPQTSPPPGVQPLAILTVNDPNTTGDYEATVTNVPPDSEVIAEVQFQGKTLEPINLATGVVGTGGSGGTGGTGGTGGCDGSCCQCARPQTPASVTKSTLHALGLGLMIAGAFFFRRRR